MQVDKLVIYNDYIEAQRQQTTWMTTTKSNCWNKLNKQTRSN